MCNLLKIALNLLNYSLWCLHAGFQHDKRIPRTFYIDHQPLDPSHSPARRIAVFTHCIQHSSGIVAGFLPAFAFSHRETSIYECLVCDSPRPLYRLTPFVGSDERRLRHLNSPFGSSRIASSAYQKWPTKSSPCHSGQLDISCVINMKIKSSLVKSVI